MFTLHPNLTRETLSKTLRFEKQNSQLSKTKRNKNKLFNNNEVYYKNFQQLNNLKICVYPNIWNDKFIFKLIDDNKLLIKRSDSKDGWHFDLRILIINENYEEKIINIGICKSNLKEINI